MPYNVLQNDKLHFQSHLICINLVWNQIYLAEYRIILLASFQKYVVPHKFDAFTSDQVNVNVFVSYGPMYLIGFTKRQIAVMIQAPGCSVFWLIF